MSDFPRRPDRTVDVLAVLRESTPLLSGRELPPTKEELRALAAETAHRSRRVWAAMMLTEDPLVLNSILRGDAVIVGKLDWVVLSRALRGRPIPAAKDYVVVTDGMLDAVAEAGAIV